MSSKNQKRTKKRTTAKHKQDVSNQYKPIFKLVEENQNKWCQRIHADLGAFKVLDDHFNKMRLALDCLYVDDFDGFVEHYPGKWDFYGLCSCWDWCACPSSRTLEDEIDDLAKCDRKLSDEAKEFIKNGKYK